MCNHSAFVLLLAVSLLFNCSLSSPVASSKNSNANGNVFNFLLGLYKINPLKGSPVYQSFSNNLLMGIGRSNKDRVDLNSKSSESVIVNKHVKTNLNEIEKMIHTRNKKPAKDIERPAYDLDDVMSTENFKAEFVINNKVLSKEEFQRALLDNHNNREDFSSLFDHIGSNETDNEIPVTKLLPVNDTIIPYSQVPSRNEAMSELANSKIIPGNHIDTLSKISDRNQEEIRMDNLKEGIVDVIIF